jgi:hypothetical protein
MSTINSRIYVVAAIVASLLFVMPAYAQGGYGTSSISLNPSNASVSSGFATTTQYTVNLTTGGTWGTSISISNAGALAGQGINVSFSNASGNPPFSGTAQIVTSGATLPGVYQIDFVATGDDPSSNATVFTLTIPRQATTSITSGYNSTGTNSTGKNTTGTNSTGRNTTSPPTYTTTVSYSSGTSPSNYGQSSTALDVSILAVIVLFLVIILALKFA